MGPGYWKKKYDDLLKRLDGAEPAKQAMHVDQPPPSALQVKLVEQLRERQSETLEAQVKLKSLCEALLE